MPIEKFLLERVAYFSDGTIYTDEFELFVSSGAIENHKTNTLADWREDVKKKHKKTVDRVEVLIKKQIF